MTTKPKTKGKKAAVTPKKPDENIPTISALLTRGRADSVLQGIDYFKESDMSPDKQKRKGRKIGFTAKKRAEFLNALIEKGTRTHAAVAVGFRLQTIMEHEKADSRFAEHIVEAGNVRADILEGEIEHRGLAPAIEIKQTKDGEMVSVGNNDDMLKLAHKIRRPEAHNRKEITHKGEITQNIFEIPTVLDPETSRVQLEDS